MFPESSSTMRASTSPTRSSSRQDYESDSTRGPLASRTSPKYIHVHGMIATVASIVAVDPEGTHQKPKPSAPAGTLSPASTSSCPLGPSSHPPSAGSTRSPPAPACNLQSDRTATFALSKIKLDSVPGPKYLAAIGIRNVVNDPRHLVSNSPR